MANEEKIRILDEQPVENAGSLLYIRTLAGSSDASKPTSLLANGSLFIETDTGKVFIFDEDDGWTEMQAGGGGGSNKFIVTLTPTSPDFSGTMDKTVAEINAAYEAGMEIWFKITAEGYDIFIPISSCDVSSSYTYPSFDCRMVDIITNVMVCVATEPTDDGTKQTYTTRNYTLSTLGY